MRHKPLKSTTIRQLPPHGRDSSSLSTKTPRPGPIVGSHTQSERLNGNTSKTSSGNQIAKRPKVAPNKPNIKVRKQNQANADVSKQISSGSTTAPQKEPLQQAVASKASSSSPLSPSGKRNDETFLPPEMALAMEEDRTRRQSSQSVAPTPYDHVFQQSSPAVKQPLQPRRPGPKFAPNPSKSKKRKRPAKVIGKDRTQEPVIGSGMSSLDPIELPDSPQATKKSKTTIKVKTVPSAAASSASSTRNDVNVSTGGTKPAVRSKKQARKQSSVPAVPPTTHPPIEPTVPTSWVHTTQWIQPPDASVSVQKPAIQSKAFIGTPIDGTNSNAFLIAAIATSKKDPKKSSAKKKTSPLNKKGSSNLVAPPLAQLETKTTRKKKTANATASKTTAKRGDRSLSADNTKKVESPKKVTPKEKTSAKKKSQKAESVSKNKKVPGKQANNSKKRSGADADIVKSDTKKKAKKVKVETTSTSNTVVPGGGVIDLDVSIPAANATIISSNNAANAAVATALFFPVENPFFDHRDETDGIEGFMRGNTDRLLDYPPIIDNPPYEELIADSSKHSSASKSGPSFKPNIIKKPKTTMSNAAPAVAPKFKPNKAKLKMVPATPNPAVASAKAPHLTEDVSPAVFLGEKQKLGRFYHGSKQLGSSAMLRHRFERQEDEMQRSRSGPNRRTGGRSNMMRPPPPPASRYSPPPPPPPPERYRSQRYSSRNVIGGNSSNFRPFYRSSSSNQTSWEPSRPGTGRDDNSGWKHSPSRGYDDYADLRATDWNHDNVVRGFGPVKVPKPFFQDGGDQRFHRSPGRGSQSFHQNRWPMNDGRSVEQNYGQRNPGYFSPRRGLTHVNGHSGNQSSFNGPSRNAPPRWERRVSQFKISSYNISRGKDRSMPPSKPTEAARSESNGVLTSSETYVPPEDMMGTNNNPKSESFVGDFQKGHFEAGQIMRKAPETAKEEETKNREVFGQKKKQSCGKEKIETSQSASLSSVHCESMVMLAEDKEALLEPDPPEHVDTYGPGIHESKECKDLSGMLHRRTGKSELNFPEKMMDRDVKKQEGVLQNANTAIPAGHLLYQEKKIDDALDQRCLVQEGQIFITEGGSRHQSSGDERETRQQDDTAKEHDDQGKQCNPSAGIPHPGSRNEDLGSAPSMQSALKGADSLPQTKNENGQADHSTHEFEKVIHRFKEITQPDGHLLPAERVVDTSFYPSRMKNSLDCLPADSKMEEDYESSASRTNIRDGVTEIQKPLAEDKRDNSREPDLSADNFKTDIRKLSESNDPKNANSTFLGSQQAQSAPGNGSEISSFSIPQSTPNESDRSDKQPEPPVTPRNRAPKKTCPVQATQNARSVAPKKPTFRPKKSESTSVKKISSRNSSPFAQESPSSAERRFVFAAPGRSENASTNQQKRSIPVNGAPQKRNAQQAENFMGMTAEDALREQERLLQAAAARMRTSQARQARFHVTSGNSHTSAHALNRRFAIRVEEIHKKFPDHWRYTDLYSRLGLPHSADDAMIKAQYRKLALVYHPDRNLQSVDTKPKFQAVTEAYHALMHR
jgi:DnaJ domain